MTAEFAESIIENYIRKELPNYMDGFIFVKENYIYNLEAKVVWWVCEFKTGKKIARIYDFQMIDALKIFYDL